jgi:hypothetical protein
MLTDAFATAVGKEIHAKRKWLEKYCPQEYQS